MKCPECKGTLVNTAEPRIFKCQACQNRVTLATDPKTKEKVIIWYSKQQEKAITKTWRATINKKGIKYACQSREQEYSHT